MLESLFSKLSLQGSVTTRSLAIFCLVLLFAACTDYVEQIDERIEGFEAHEKARAESEIRVSDVEVSPDSIFFGELKDSRDGLVYKTVTIGTLTWMAENLNYKAANSFCYNDKAKYCDKYGRLYTWATAMDSAGLSSSNGKGCGYGKLCAPTYPVRGVCPENWHLPSKGEWDALRAAVHKSGHGLKTKRGWNNDGGGSDSYGFSMMPSGAKTVNGKYFYEGSKGIFWLSTEDYKKEAICAYFYTDGEYGAQDEYSEKSYAYSVRCVKDTRDKKPVPESSSPAPYVKPCKIDSTDSCKYGTLKDSRDGKTYKTVSIGTQIWMAENLNYKTKNSYCYDDVDSNCKTYGRIYPWATAMDSTGTFSSNALDCGYGWRCRPTYPVRGICPEGWHLPTKMEWNTLFDAVGGQSQAAKKLKSMSGWDGGNEAKEKKSDFNGEDAYGFTAISSGDREYSGEYRDSRGKYTYFWSSTEDDDGDASYIWLSFFEDDAHLGGGYKLDSYSIRCVKD